jgi:hypothetical protein
MPGKKGIKFLQGCPRITERYRQYPNLHKFSPILFLPCPYIAALSCRSALLLAAAEEQGRPAVLSSMPYTSELGGEGQPEPVVVVVVVRADAAAAG